MSSWRSISTVAPVSLLTATALFLNGCEKDVDAGARPAFPTADSIESVAIQVWDKSPAMIEEKRTTDRRAIRSLLAVLDGGQPIAQHKCAAWSRILLYPASGAVIELRFLPGHDNDNYEFRQAGAPFLVSRAPFRDALRAVGAKQLP